MTIELTFSKEEIAALFRSAGLTVEMREMPFTFPRHGSTDETVVLKVWTVENPHTGKAEKLTDMFRKYMYVKKKELFLSEDNKMKIFNLFDKQ